MAALQRPKPALMTADDFLDWAAAREHGKHELVDGKIVSMAPERADHADAKGEIYAAFRDAIRTKKLACKAYVDGLTVRVDDETRYEPDVLVNCGPPVPSKSMTAVNPVVVVEVISESSRQKDTSIKLADYFRVGSIQHYLVVDLGRRLLLHHRRGEGESIVTVIVKNGNLLLDPPGIEFSLDNVFPLPDTV